MIAIGTANLTKSGSGNLTLSGTNTYTGATTINAGTLSISSVANGGSNSNLGASSNAATNLVLGGGTLTYTGTNASTDRNFTLTNGTTSTISVSTSTETLTLSGASAAGNGSLTKVGAGTLSLTRANNHSGNTTVSAGTLALGNVNALQNSTLNTGTSGSQVVTFTVAGTNTYNLGGLAGSDALDIGGNSLSVGSNNADTTFSAVLSGSGNLTKTGLGTLILSGSNTYSGKTAINGGTIQFNNSSAFGTSAVLLNNGTLSSTSTTARSFANAITIGGNVQIGNATQTGAITASGNIDLGDAVRTLTIVGDGSALGGVISGNGGLAKSGTARLTLSGANTYTGATILNSGSLTLGASNVIGDSSAVTVNGGTLEIGGNTERIHSLALEGGAVTIGSGNLTLSNASLITGGSLTMTSSSGRINTEGLLTLGTATINYTSSGGNTNALVLGGNIVVDTSSTFQFLDSGGSSSNDPRINLNNANRVIDVDEGANLDIGWVVWSSTNSQGSITKNGNGILTLSAANANLYSGATTINAGTLVLNNTNTSSAIAINSGGTLAGTGSGGATTVNNGGRISPGGSSSGTLATSSLTLEGGGGYTFTIGNVAGTAGANWDLINVGGGSGAVTINSTSGSPFTIFLNGSPTGWSDSGTYAWNIISSNNVTGFAADDFAFNLAGFNGGAAPTGTFYMTNSGSALVLHYAILGDSVWNGGNGNWDTGFSPVPTNLANVIFAGEGGTATNNISSGSFSKLQSITFNSTAGSYTLAANSGSAGASATPLLISGSIANGSANAQTINLALTFEATRVVDTASGNITIGGVISGAGGLTKNGAHTLTLSGTNTFNGSVQINSGTLATTVVNALADTVDVTVASGATYSHSGAGNDQIRSLNASGSVLINSGTLTIGGNVSSTVSGQISGNGLLIKSDTGSLTLSNSANNYSGGTRLTAGALLVGHDNALGSGALNFNDSTNGTIRTTDGTTRTISNALGTISGSSWNVNFGTADSGDLVFSSTTSASLGSGATRTFTVNNAATTFAMAFTNTSNLLKAGNGTMILTGSSTYTGSTTINAGTLQLGNGGTTGALSTSSAITVNGTLAFNRTDSVTQGTNFSNTLGGSGVLVQNGSSTLILNQANTYSGGTTLNSGTLRLEHAGAAGTGTITQSSGASLLHLNATGTFANAMGVYNVRASETLTLSGGITVHNATFDVDSGDTLTISGGISGSGGVIKNGTGSLVLSGSNSFTGATTVNAGTLQAAAANALGSTSSVVVNTGGSLLVTAGGSINNTAGLTLAGGTLSMNGTFNETLGALTLAANSIIDLNGFNGTLTFSGVGVWAADTTLAITNWSGVNKYGTPVGSGDADRHVVFTNTTGFASYLDRISFYSGDFGQGFAGTAFQIALAPGPGEIAPVPEPETWVTGVILIVGGLVWMIRRQRARNSSKAARQEALKFSESTH